MPGRSGLQSALALVGTGRGLFVISEILGRVEVSDFSTFFTGPWTCLVEPGVGFVVIVYLVSLSHVFLLAKDAYEAFAKPQPHLRLRTPSPPLSFYSD